MARFDGGLHVGLKRLKKTIRPEACIDSKRLSDIVGIFFPQNTPQPSDLAMKIIKTLTISSSLLFIGGTSAMAACSTGYNEYNQRTWSPDIIYTVVIQSGGIYCLGALCESIPPGRADQADRVRSGWQRLDGVYLCVPQSQPSSSSWGGSPSAGQTVLGGLVGLLAWGLANSNSGQSSSGSGYSSSVPDTTAAEQGRREQEFIQLQRQEQQMRQQYPPQR